jgi:hypothetical protein
MDYSVVFLMDDSALELAIYRKTIAILDYYPLIKNSQPKLHKAVAHEISRHQEFESLIRAMASL